MATYPVGTAILYGIFMWIITTRIVMPLSNTPKGGSFVWWKAIKAVSILIVMIGLPLSFIAGKYYKNLSQKIT